MSAAEVESGNEWLPDRCPAWCAGGHAEAVAEGNPWDSAQEHIRSGGGDCLSELRYAGRPVRTWGGGWDLVAKQRPLSANGGYWGPPLIAMSVDSSHRGQRERGVTIDITSGEARVLARQLVDLADRLDLG